MMNREIIPFKYSYWRLVTFFEKRYGPTGRNISNILLSFSLCFFPVFFSGLIGLVVSVPFLLWVFFSEWGDMDTTTSKLKTLKKLFADSELTGEQ